MNFTTLVKASYVITTASSAIVAGTSLYVAKKQRELNATVKGTNWRHVMWDADKQQFVVIPIS